MHETIHQFAQEQLRGSDQEADALARKYDAPFALGLGLGQLAEMQMALIENGGAPGGVPRRQPPWGADEAAANFREATTILRAISKLHMAYDAEIGLAELTRRRGQIDSALQLITPILPYLPTNGLDG